MKTKMINLFGAPCSGKSTRAAEIYVDLKKHNRKVYLAQEVATDYILQGNTAVLMDQRKLFDEQYARNHLAKGSVEFVVTDCPLLLNIVYARLNGTSTKDFEKEVVEAHIRENNINIMLSLSENFYDKTNRVHSFTQAKEIEREIIRVLNELHIPFMGDYHAKSF